MSIEFVGGFESTYLPRHDVDVFELTGHASRWRDDLALLAGCGVRRLRYPARWHRVEPRPGAYDWRDTDAVLGHLQERGMTPIVDLVHHTSYPRWLAGGFGDPRFGPAYLRFCEAFARRYPWTSDYTLFNEPFSTLFLAGHEAIWPPHRRGTEGFVALCANVLPAVAEASRMYRDLLPDARHLYVDTCERHDPGDPGAEPYTAYANDRRFFVLDLFLGRDLDPARPFVADALRAADALGAGGERLLGMEPGRLDVLGLDFYAHSQWQFAGRGGVTPSPAPGGLAALIVEYWQRYRLPCALSETNIRGFASDRASWLKYTLEQCELAVEAGVALEGYCWFPFVDSCDWDSLLARADRHIDPVGVYWLDERLERHPSVMSASYAAAARGAPASALPAYRFRPPVSGQLAGYLPQMAHWDWLPPPAGAPTDQDARLESRIP